MKLNTTLSLLTIISLTACSSPESIQTKMNRYKTHQQNKYQNSEFIIIGDKTYGNVKRTIASVPIESKADAEKTPEFTNKKLYFLGLLDQYEFFRSFATDPTAPKLSLCPAFHSGVISYYEKNANTNEVRSIAKNYDYNSITDSNYINKNPELYLSLSLNEKYPNVLTYIQDKKITNSEKIKEVVKTAINTHLTKTYFELRELCENGQSDNYYIYENMISYFKSHNQKQDTKTLNTMLKSNVFSNLAIINSLKTENAGPKRTIASENTNFGSNYNDQIIGKFNAEWTKDYFNSL